MKRLFLYGMIGCILAIFLPSVVSASDTSDALYAGTIKVTNNGTATTGVATTISGINTTSLIADGFLHSSANDSAILRSGSDVAFMPGYGTNPWILYVASIGADTTFNDIFYTPNVPDGKESYFPDTSGMTTSNAASLELGDNFTITLSDVWIDTTAGSGKYIFDKNGAIVIKVSPSESGNISASIVGSDEGTNSTTTYKALEGTTIRAGERLNSFPATVIHAAEFYMAKTGNPSGTITCTVRSVSGDTLLGNLGTMECSGITGAAWYRFDTSKVPVSTSQDIRVSIEYSGGDGANYVVMYGDTGDPYASGVITSYVASWTDTAANDADFKVFYEDTTVSVTGISSGEYDITVSADETDLEINVSGSSDSTALGGASVLDTDDDIVSFENDTVLYAGSQEIEVDGVQVQYVDWDYGTTFTDQSGNSNDATPTFRTTSSDADVSAELTEFYPISEATAPAYAVSDAEDFISGAPNITGNFTTSLDPSFPGSEIIEDTATGGGTPVQMPFIWLGCLGLLAASFLTSSVATYFRSNSILPKILVVGIIAAALVGLKVFDFWMLLYLIIPLLAFAVAKTHTTWGGESGYNMAGFLAMSFVGMTIVNRIMEGVFLSSTDVSILNNVLVFRPVNVFGLFQISVPNMSFLTQGLPHLIRWDYSFFGGNAVIIQYLFYSITAFMAFLLFIIMLGVVFNMLSRSR